MALRYLVLLCLTMGAGALAQPGNYAVDGYADMASAGSDIDRTEPWFQQCLHVQALSEPALAQQPASCNAFDYYDKLAQAHTSDAEWRGVRACAAAAKDNGVLAMLSANGMGVPRDLDLATHYACRAGGALVEMRYRIAHLQALKTTAPGKPYDQCDDVTSSYMMVMCTSLADGQAEKVRNAYFARLRRRLPPQQVHAFDQLIATTRAFADARSAETDGGSIRAAMQLHAQSREKEWVREHLAAFDQGTATLPPADQFASDDAALNRLYRRLMASPSTDVDAPDRLPGSMVTRTDMRNGQRAWLAYRDAWIRFAALRYPAVAPDALRAALTRWRSKQLSRAG